MADKNGPPGPLDIDIAHHQVPKKVISAALVQGLPLTEVNAIYSRGAMVPLRLIKTPSP